MNRTDKIALHYFFVLNGHHHERSKNWFQHLKTVTVHEADWPVDDGQYDTCILQSSASAAV
jgi:hypothetical protein